LEIRRKKFMNMRLKPVVLGLVVSGAICSQAFAANSAPDSTAHMQQELNQVVAQTQHLQGQVTSLKQTVSDLRTELKKSKASGQSVGVAGQLPSQAQLNQENLENNPSVRKAVHAYSYVRLGSYLNQQATFDGKELVISSPSILEDQALLQNHYQIAQDVKANKLPAEQHPYLKLSGELEGQAIYTKPYSGSYTSDIDLTDAELQAEIGVTPFVTGFLGLAYDNDQAMTAGNRVQKSRVYLNKAFITFGDFTKSPYYASVGQMYLPFGRYASSMVTPPYIRTIGRTKARAILVGFKDQGANSFYGETYDYRGPSGRANKWGLDGGMNFTINSKISGLIGASYISTLADSVGLQDTGTTTGFQGFGENGQPTNRVPAYDVYGQLTLNPFNITAEYLKATKSFKQSELSYNDHGAEPSGYNIEGAYTFNMMNVASSWAIGYQHTSEALAIGVPKQAWSTTLNMNIWKDTLLSFEFRHDINYGKGDTATGPDSTQAVPDSSFLGKSDNAVTAQIDLYF
jgi:hypothetical protein